ncbi:hypothetical protein FDUTEX481_08667 [Tolypothrix sp. PCC 7601]|uniref:Plasmid addiction system poison protein-like protein n=1 Tax=Microchaete diplosiphon TaxID=1197 RepID=Q6H066_MICDP|nr:plasmid addiction system poison protein-like protein [Fremyella diplosiphon Fd33]EKF00525.1 hypothetical protein FDUTEX481_08667 [Tolypothrix sp. PCC 7601]
MSKILFLYLLASMQNAIQNSGCIEFNQTSLCVKYSHDNGDKTLPNFSRPKRSLITFMTHKLHCDGRSPQQTPARVHHLSNRSPCNPQFCSGITLHNLLLGL